MKKILIMFLFFSLALFCLADEKNPESQAFAANWNFYQYAGNNDSPSMSRGKIASWTILITGLAMTLGGTIWSISEGSVWERNGKPYGLIVNGGITAILGTSLLFTFHR